MIRNNANLCKCTDPVSQIPILVTALTVKKTNLHERFHTVKKALMTFHHDASNSHVPDINFLEFLLHVFSLTRHYS